METVRACAYRPTQAVTSCLTADYSHQFLYVRGADTPTQLTIPTTMVVSRQRDVCNGSKSSIYFLTGVQNTGLKLDFMVRWLFRCGVLRDSGLDLCVSFLQATTTETLESVQDDVLGEGDVPNPLRGLQYSGIASGMKVTLYDGSSELEEPLKNCLRSEGEDCVWGDDSVGRCVRAASAPLPSWQACGTNSAPTSQRPLPHSL